MRHKVSTKIRKTLTMLFCPCRINKCKCRCVPNQKIIKATLTNVTENKKTNKSTVLMSSQVETKEQQYNKIKQQIEFEDKARRELDDKKWDEALLIVQNAIRMKNFNEIKSPIKRVFKMLWNTLVGCLLFHKVNSKDSNENIITFILMRMFSYLFLQFISFLFGGFTMLCLIALLRNAYLCVLYLFNPYVQKETLLGITSIPFAGLIYLLWVGHGLFKAASVEIEKSKNKSHISMVFGVISAVVIAVFSIFIPIIISKQMGG